MTTSYYDEKENSYYFKMVLLTVTIMGLLIWLNYFIYHNGYNEVYQTGMRFVLIPSWIAILVSFGFLCSGVSNLLGIDWSSFDTGDSGSGYYQSMHKSCSACGRGVSVSAMAGQRCPHCGAYWSDERTMYM